MSAYAADHFHMNGSMIRDIEVDFSVNSLLTEVKKKLLISWMFCIGKDSNLVVCISLANKVSVVLMKITKHPHHGQKFPPW